MKALKFLKMNMALAGLAIMMSGCLNSDDPDFTININQAFVSQYGTGDQAVFAPYISVYSLTHAVQSATLGYDNNTYQFNRIGNISNSMQISANVYGGFPVSPVIPNGTYTVNAVSSPEGLAANNAFTINIDKDLKLGPITLKSFTYKASEGIRAEWEPVENAKSYGLVITPLVEIEGVYTSLGKGLYLWEDDNHGSENTGFFNPAGVFPEGQRLRVSFAAYGGKNTQMPNVLVLESTSIDIIWGTDYEEDVPSVE